MRGISFNLDMMEFCAESSHSNGKQILKHSKPADEVKRSSEKAHRNSHSNVKQNFKQTSTFVNHGELVIVMFIV